MKKFLLLTFVLISGAAGAQLKVFQSGKVALGDIVTEPSSSLRVPESLKITSPVGSFDIYSISFNNNQDGITYLVRDHDGGKGIQISKKGDVHIHSRNNDNWGMLSLTQANKALSKCWVVQDPNTNVSNFYVTGEGNAFTNGKLLKSALKVNYEEREIIEDASALLSQLDPFRMVDQATAQLGLDSRQLQRAIPEAVEYMEDSVEAIDYTEVVPVLVAAFNEQSQIIQTLQEDVENLLDIIANPFFLETESTTEKGMRLGEAQGIQNENNQNQSANSLLQKELLQQNNPNPFNQKTTIRYKLPQGTLQASMLFFDLQGNLKQAKQLPAKEGMARLTLQAQTLPPGMYLYTLVLNGKEVATKRMIITP